VHDFKYAIPISVFGTGFASSAAGAAKSAFPVVI
jgi:hypothetical protein